MSQPLCATIREYKTESGVIEDLGELQSNYLRIDQGDASFQPAEPASPVDCGCDGLQLGFAFERESILDRFESSFEIQLGRELVDEVRSAL